MSIERHDSIMNGRAAQTAKQVERGPSPRPSLPCHALMK
ncbi:hypothetical protein FBY03_103130 [Pseudomonas sp. SJZ079]|jgi:hypothetical protein|nr:hypothetical protein FBY03_103130 [Pseudomonas sp. SJZ079]